GEVKTEDIEVVDLGQSAAGSQNWGGWERRRTAAEGARELGIQGAFLIPYLLMNFFQAVPPALHMELLLGQMNQRGPIAVWDICPHRQGLGWPRTHELPGCILLITSFIGWCFLYLFNSLSPTDALPWMKCDNHFNTRWCVTVEQYRNLSAQNLSANAVAGLRGTGSSRLHQSSGIDRLGSPKLGLVHLLLCGLHLPVLSLWRGVKTSGKVFYSTGAGFGSTLALASYQQQDQQLLPDSLIATARPTVRASFCRVRVFSYPGTRWAEAPGWYSKCTQWPSAPCQWPSGSILVLRPAHHLGLDSAVSLADAEVSVALTIKLTEIAAKTVSRWAAMESVLTEFGDYLEKRLGKYRFFPSAVVVYAAFLVSILLCTPGGMYLWNLFNNFSAGLSIIFVAFTQAFCVPGFMGSRPESIGDCAGNSSLPVFILVIIVFNCISLADPSSFLYSYQYTEYHPELFPNRTADASYRQSHRLVMCFSQIALIPVVAIIVIIYYRSLAKP
uniref:ABC2_membrane domain-containing protein n=1 Tax=Macrostomum lignano TaxID=282301 RepID=A0A1I8F7R2_9PLAT